MKIALIIGRILLGGLFTFSAISFLFGLGEMPPFEGKALNFMSGLGGSGYFMVFLKIIELICGIAILSGQFTSLAAVVLAPITINIFLFHAFLDPKTIPVSIVLLVLNIFILYANKEKYTLLFARK